MIIIITPLSFIPAMNIYETALLIEPNWKSIYATRTEDRREMEGEQTGGNNGSGFALVPFSVHCLLFSMQR